MMLEIMLTESIKFESLVDILKNAKASTFYSIFEGVDRTVWHLELESADEALEVIDRASKVVGCLSLDKIDGGYRLYIANPIDRI